MKKKMYRFNQITSYRDENLVMTETKSGHVFAESELHAKELLYSAMDEDYLHEGKLQIMEEESEKQATEVLANRHSKEALKDWKEAVDKRKEDLDQDNSHDD